MNVEMQKGTNLDSDHFLTNIKFRYLPLNEKRSTHRRIIKTGSEKSSKMKPLFKICYRKEDGGLGRHLEKHDSQSKKNSLYNICTNIVYAQIQTVAYVMALNQRATAYKAWQADKTEDKPKPYRDVQKQMTKVFQKAKTN